MNLSTRPKLWCGVEVWRPHTPPVREIVLVADLTGLDAENCAAAATSVPKVASFDPAPVVAEHVARVPVLRLL